MDIFDLSAKITLDSSEFEKGVNESGNAMEGLSAKAVALGNAIYDIGKAAVSAFGTLAKSALEGYANFEQLTGGIDTLFKGNSDTVKQYADNAFRTAGLSANDYMETATSFAASLINSLGGDTAAAADMADMAITDMSDNANKMGSSMESIQNAYQGFAKQNYTMLDNLKLGYGGTAAEMYRLLQDAANLNDEFAETANFSIDGKGHLEAGYADIVEAIHIVQTEMNISGITAEEAAEAVAAGVMTEEEAFNALGTTAKEAEKTISGSVASMKAAWENWLVGLGDEGADLSGLTDNLITSLETVIGNVMPVMSRIKDSLAEVFVDVFADLTGIDLTPVLDKFNSIKDGISGFLTEIQGTFDQLKSAFEEGDISGVLSKVGEAISGALQSIVAELPTLVQGIVEGLTSKYSLIIEAGVQLLSGIIEAIPQVLPLITESLPQILDTIAQGLTQNVQSIVQAGVQLFSALVEAIPQVLPVLAEAIPGLIQGIGEALLQGAEIIMQAGVQLFSALLSNLPVILEALLPLVTELLIELVNLILGSIQLFVDTGVQLFTALIQNLPEILAQIMAVLPELIIGIVEAILSHVPEMMQAGIDLFVAIVSDIPAILAEIIIGIIELIDGIVEEIISHKGDIIEAGKNLLSGLAEGIEQAVSGVIESAKTAATKVITKVKEVFGIASPSKVFAEIGRYSMEGLALGFEDGYNKYSGDIADTIAEVIPNHMTSTVDFASSAIGKSSSAQISSMLNGMNERSGNYSINLVVDGRTLANVIFDPLSGVAKQKGVALGA